MATGLCGETIMSIKLKDILMTILPFLFSAIEREWKKLPEKTKEVMIESAKIGQLLKTSYKMGYDACVKLIAEQFGMTNEEVDKMLMTLANLMGFDINTPYEFFDRLELEAAKRVENSSWDSLWTTLQGQLHVIRTEGRMKWPQLAMGLIQFVFEKFILPHNKK